MADYRARIRDRTGVHTIDVIAPNLKLAREKAGLQGRVIDIKRSGSWNVFGLSFSDRQIFLARLSQMIGSGLGDGESVKLMKRTFRGDIKRVAMRIDAALESGAPSLPDAIAAVGSPDFPPNVVEMIRSGSQAGETHRALKEAARFEQEMGQIKKGGGTAMLKSVAVMVISMIIILATAWYGYPRIRDNRMIEQYESAIQVGWAEQLANGTAWFIVVMLVLMGVLGFIATVGRLVMPRWADAVIMRIPFFKDLVLARYNYIAFYSLSLLIETGVRLTPALTLTADAMRPGALKTDFQRAIRALERGKEWEQEMKSLHPTDRAALASSMDQTQQAKTLANIGEQYKELYRIRMEAFSPILQGIASLTMVVAGVIIFALIIMPMMQVMQEMI